MELVMEYFRPRQFHQFPHPFHIRRAWRPTKIGHGMMECLLCLQAELQPSGTGPAPAHSLRGVVGFVSQFTSTALRKRIKAYSIVPGRAITP
jgi:hypothetical protein